MEHSAWRVYQEEAAAFFRSLGFEASVEETVEGARSRHRLDVLVDLAAYGVRQRWVVECKAWQRRVSKQEVLVLQGVVEDVGGDRGFLLSEKGFQTGAITAAQHTNITLTDLGELRTNAEADLQETRWDLLYARWLRWSQRKHGLWIDTDSGSRLEPPPTWFDYVRVSNRGFGLETGIQQAKTKQFPATYDCDTDTEMQRLCPKRADDMPTFLDESELVMTELEDWLDAQVGARQA